MGKLFSGPTKMPRTSRICLNCGHKYGSHTGGPFCLKVVQRNPRKECDCPMFIETQEQLNKLLDSKKSEDRIDVSKPDKRRTMKGIVAEIVVSRKRNNIAKRVVRSN